MQDGAADVRCTLSFPRVCFGLASYMSDDFPFTGERARSPEKWFYIQKYTHYREIEMRRDLRAEGREERVKLFGRLAEEKRVR